MTKKTFRLFAVVGLAGSLAACVAPAPNPDDPSQRRIAMLEQKVAALETKLRGLGNADVLGQLEGIEKRERDIRGQLEKVGFDLESAQRRQKEISKPVKKKTKNSTRQINK